MKQVRFGQIIESLDERFLLAQAEPMTRRRFLKWAFAGSLMLTGSTALSLLQVENAWADRFGGPVDVQVPLMDDAFWSSFSNSQALTMRNPVGEGISSSPMAARDAYNQFLRCWADGSQEKMDEEFLIKLAKMDYLLRKYGIQSPIYTSSGFRSSEHNSTVGGATNSMHVYRCASDNIVAGLTPNQLGWVAYQAGFQWVGISTGGHGNFCHTDTRPQNRQTVFFYN